MLRTLSFTALMTLSAVLPAQPRQFSRAAFENIPARGDGETQFLPLPMDIDGDGRTDVLELAASSPSRWLRQTAPRRFIEAGAVPVDMTRARVGIADLDGDGTEDLLIGTVAGTTVDILLSDATPLSGIDATLNVDFTNAWSIITGDVDADGDVDVVVGEQLFLNNGAASFIKRNGSIQSVAAANHGQLIDVDGDGDLDYVRALNFGRAAEVLLNDGNGNFSLKVDAITPKTAAYQVLVMDVDHDQDLDLLLVDVAGVAVRLNDGRGSFSAAGDLPPVVAFAVLDVTGDSREDLVTSDGTVYASSPQGLITRSIAVPVEPMIHWRAADLDGDRDMDLIGSSGYWINTGSGFVDLGDQPRLGSPAAILDVNGDGSPDLIGQRPNSREFSISLSDGTGRFGVADVPFNLRWISGWIPLEFVTGDVDGDGDVDLFQQQRQSVALNNGDGSFSAGPGIPERFTKLALGDLDGDGDLDASATEPTTTKIYANDGSGRFTLWRTLPNLQHFASHVRHVDLDGDGDLDIVTRERSTQTARPLHVYWNAGAGSFVSGQPIAVSGDSIDAMQFGDLDGDGDVDILASTIALENRGNGQFLNAHTFPAIRRPALVDIDNDGDLDVWSRNPNQLFRNDGRWNFVDITSHVPSTSADAPVAFGDLDGDGDVDALAASGVLLNNHRQIRLRHMTAPGSTIDLELTDSPGYGAGNGLAFTWLAARTAAVDLGPIGILRIDPATAVALPAVPLAQPTGSATAVIPVPNAASLAGTTVHAQAVILTSRGLPLRLTGRERIDIIR